MKVLSLSILAAVSALLVSAAPTNSVSEVCVGQEILSETYIGQNKDVKLAHVFCPDNAKRSADSLIARQSGNATNVCGAECDTNCFTPSGGGPDPNDCHVIADALRFESQNTGALFEIGTGSNNTIALFYSSCETFFVNQDLTNDLDYCRTDWAAVVDFVAPNCQATQNAHGGNCVAADQRWFIQVQHV